MPKLYDVKTFSRPSRKIVEYLVDVLWDTAPDALLVYDDLKALANISRLDTSQVDSATAKFTAQSSRRFNYLCPQFGGRNSPNSILDHRENQQQTGI